MAKVTLGIGTPTSYTANNFVQWDERDDGLGDLSALSDPAGEARALIRLRIFQTSQIQFQVIDVPDGRSGFGSSEELSTAWEAHASAITLRAAGVADLVIPGPDNSQNSSTDTSEPYAWSQGTDGTTRQSAWFDAYVTAGQPALTLIVNDGEDAEGITASVVFGDAGATLTNHAVDAEGITASVAFGDAGATHTQAGDAEGITASVVFGDAGSTLTSNHAVDAEGITASVVFGDAGETHTISHAVSARGIRASVVFGNAGAAHNLSPLGPPRFVMAEVDGESVAVGWERPEASPRPVIFYELSIDAGSTWIATEKDALEWTLKDVQLDVSIRVTVRARDTEVTGPWSGPSSPITVRRSSRIEAVSDLSLFQWNDASRIKGIVNIVLDLLREHVDTPRAYMATQTTIERAEGVWLDAIGVRLGLPRPSSTRGASDPRFGFDDAGTGFDQAPFSGSEENAARAPIGDELYRKLLRARSFALQSTGKPRDFRNAVLAVDPSASVQDKHNMTVRVVTSLGWQIELADEVSALGRPAGVLMTIADRGRFGFDDAGTGFDQGPFSSA